MQNPDGQVFIYDLLQVYFLTILCWVKAEFTCTAVGRFADHSDTTCKNFYICSKKSDGQYIKTASSCSSDKLFNPDINRCSNDYTCQFTTTTSSTTEITTTQEPEFTCIAVGRYNNPQDKLCKTYYLCSKLGSSFIKTLYKCPTASVFDPDQHKCSTQYICPYITTEAPTSTTTSMDTTLYDEITTEEQATTIFDLPSTTTENTVTVSYPPTANFVCFSVGRYANFNDNRCKWYYLCNQLHNGSFIQTPYSCPKDSVFDPSIDKCSLLYGCPSLVNEIGEAFGS